MKKFSVAFLVALFIAPALLKADPVNANQTTTNTPAANGGSENSMTPQNTGKKDKSAKHHSKHKHKEHHDVK